MVLELLFVSLLLFVILLIAYKSAVHEYQILQRDYTEDIEWNELMSENLPIVVRNVPKAWIGGWTASKHGNRPYTIIVKDQSGQSYKTQWNVWLQQPANTRITDMSSVTSTLTLDRVGTAILEAGFHRWFYIPSPIVKPNVLPSGHIQPLQRTTAEYTFITVTDGAPVTIWLAHEGAIGSLDLIGADPWSLTSEQVPSIGDVKYIEIRLRQFNALAIPRHWYFALRNDEESASWFTTTELHSPISRFVSIVKNGKN